MMVKKGSVTVEKFLVKDLISSGVIKEHTNKPAREYTQLSDHYGLSITLH